MTPWDEWQATPEGKLDVRALFDRMAGESPTTYAARQEAQVKRLRAALEHIEQDDPESYIAQVAREALS